MTVNEKCLEEILLDAGCSDEFVEYAVAHSSGYKGDVQRFVDYVEHLIQNDLQNTVHAETNASSLVDTGAKRVEHDYTGDNLTHGGYDHVDQNQRW